MMQERASRFEATAGEATAPASAEAQRVQQEFRRQLGSPASFLAQAPGRVNLIGEHTDYNDGFVLPMAIDRAVWIAFRPLAEPRVRAFSAQFGEWCEFNLDGLVSGGPHWAQYLRGTAWALRESGLGLRGWEGVVGGDVPIGAGLSSSAAMEVAAARAFATSSGLAWDAPRMARLAQRAENQWVGVSCGIMDQLIAASGRAGHAALIDCRSLELVHVPLPRGARVVVLDTATRRELVGSAYNERRRQCEQAAALLGARALRDLTADQLEGAAKRLEPGILRRARHVVGENERTLQAAAAMRGGRAAELGRLMNESHRSLRDDFEVSSPALDTMVSCALEAGCFGARMTGAGFGGCVVALVDEDQVASFVEQLPELYRGRSGHVAQVYVCEATGGASCSELLES
jgi:galactokinase